MEIPPLQSQIKPSVMPFDKLASNPNVSEADKIKEASRQFEAIFLRQIMGEARKTVIHSASSDDSNAASIYNDMINNQLADSISQSGAFGLAKSMQAQLAHQVLPHSSAKATPAAGAATAQTKTQN